MSFWLITAMVSLAVFGLTAAVAALFTRTVLRLVYPPLARTSPRMQANALFLFRIFPLAAGLFASVALALPAFLRFEPHLVSEAISLKLWLLAAGGGIVLTAIVARGALMLWATSKAEGLWIHRAERVQSLAAGSLVPIFRVDGFAPLLIVTGLFRAKLFISSAVLEMLSPGELGAALAHEMAHVRVFDNFKQMLFRICRPPRWLELEKETAAWVSACELAADDAALDHGASALDLAGALVKMARMKCQLTGDLAACQLLSDLPYTSLQARIVHLEKAIENSHHPARRQSRRYRLYLLALLVMPALICLPYVNSLLGAVHEILELLVR